MAELRRFHLRATYIERDRLAMLSHLEVARALERTVRRAQLPYAISQGFSPHMKIAFGAALPVGVGSTCEIFDLQLTEYVPPVRALEALQRASVPDLMVQECAYIESNARAASVAFPLSVYEVRFSHPVAAVLVPENVTVVRKRKEKVLYVADFLIEGFSPVVRGATPAGALGPGAPGAETGVAGAASSTGAPGVAGALEPDAASSTGAEAGAPGAPGAPGPDAASSTGVEAGVAASVPSDLWRFALEAKESGSLRPDALLRACLEQRMVHGDASVGAVGVAAEGLRVLSITRVEQRAS